MARNCMVASAGGQRLHLRVAALLGMSMQLHDGEGVPHLIAANNMHAKCARIWHR